jgi:hypothetical protein
MMLLAQRIITILRDIDLEFLDQFFIALTYPTISLQQSSFLYKGNDLLALQGFNT